MNGKNCTNFSYFRDIDDHDHHDREDFIFYLKIISPRPCLSLLVGVASATFIFTLVKLNPFYFNNIFGLMLYFQMDRTGLVSGFRENGDINWGKLPYFQISVFLVLSFVNLVANTNVLYSFCLIRRRRLKR